MVENDVLSYVEKSAATQLFQQQKKNVQKLRNSTINDRKKKLKALQEAILAHKEEIRDALWNDFKKPAAEVDMSEILPVISEIKHAHRHLHQWVKGQSVNTPLLFLGTSGKIHYEPKGTTLIISPWNFPVNLTFAPLVSAIAAGNTAILKPSEVSANSSAIMQKIIKEVFSSDEIAVVQGAVGETKHLLSLPFDHIFFTGSPSVGKVVMEAASKNLTSVTLELGGKSPAIIEESADLKDAAKKIVWGKFVNAGQTCVAPDYLMVHENYQQDLINYLKEYIEKFYSETPEVSSSYAHIISDKHYDHLNELYEDAIQKGAENVLLKNFSPKERFISPVVLTDVNFDMEVMQKEIFGPILPVVTYKDIGDTIEVIRKNPNPLAAYIFTKDGKIGKQLAHEISAGGICINECVIHYSHTELPFGGNRTSGMGSSHGYYGFRAFSNVKPVLKQRRGITNMDLLYPPYSKKTEKIINWILKYF